MSEEMINIVLFYESAHIKSSKVASFDFSALACGSEHEPS